MINIDDYSDTNIPKKYLKKIADCLVSCGCDQPYDKEDDEYYYIDGTQYEFGELLNELNIPEKYYQEIYDTVKCPECGNDIDVFSDVCVDFNLAEKKKFNIAFNKLQDKAKSKIEDFYSYLQKYPYLGANHKTGKDLINGIDFIKRITIKDETWYRARIPDNSRVFTKKDMLPPPKNIPIPEGRFNHYGQSHFYLGESKYVCACECSNNNDCICWIQEIKIKEINNILDLTQTIYDYPNETKPEKITSLPLTITGLLTSGKITNTQKKNISWKPEYFVPRYIADICKEKGIKGILYHSSLCFQKNLVIFNFKKKDFEFINEPYIYNFHKENFDDLF